MERNQLFSVVNNIAIQASGLIQLEDSVKLSKVQLRELADSVINDFVERDDLEALPIFLTDAFRAMDAEGVFGLRGIKMSSTSSKDKVTYRMERAAKFFQRSYKDLDMGNVLKGYNPFVFAEGGIKIEQTDEEKIQSFCIDMGMDNSAVQTVLSAYESSCNRAYARQAEARKAIKAQQEEIKKTAELDARDRLVTAMLESGMTTIQLEQLVAAKQAES